MKRAILILFIACWFAGCKSQTPAVDPFFGRTTVPPPPTGSISQQAADPYYRATQALQQPSMQTNAPLYNPGITSANPANTPSNPGYSGYNLANPSNSQAGTNWTNSSNPPRYSSPASSALASPSPASAPGVSTYPYQSMPQNNPAQGQPPGGYSPQTPPAQPASMPSTPPGSTWPGGNRYTPPGGNFNYRGTSTEVPNPQPTPSSPNRVATPFFAGGVPNRATIPMTDNGPRPLADAIGNAAVANPNANSYQNVSNPQPAYNPGSIAGGANNYPTGQSPIVRTLQPQVRDQTSSQSNNFYPASRQTTAPTPAQAPKNSPQPTWRESSSSDTRMIDDDIQAVSATESSDAQ